MVMITLPEDDNHQFNLALLVRELIRVGRPYIVQGQQHSALPGHTKPSSLDYFIRQHIAVNQDTAQATTDVIDQICATGMFVRNPHLLCPDSGNPCQGIELA